MGQHYDECHKCYSAVCHYAEWHSTNRMIKQRTRLVFMLNSRVSLLVLIGVCVGESINS
jgi:hypothetical protein